MSLAAALNRLSDNARVRKAWFGLVCAIFVCIIIVPSVFIVTKVFTDWDLVSGVLGDSASPDFLREFAGEILSSYPVLETESAPCADSVCDSAEPPISVDAATELLNFLCLEDAAGYAAHLYDISQNAPEDDHSIRLPALMTAALAYYHLREFDTAIIVVTHDEKIIPTFKRIYHIRDGVTHEEAGEGRGFE